MGLSLRAGLVFGLNREKNIPQNESEGPGPDVSPRLVQHESHIHTQSCTSDLASGTFCLPVSALPNRRGGLSSSFMVVGSQHSLDNPSEMLLLHLLSMDGMGVPSSASAGAS